MMKNLLATKLIAALCFTAITVFGTTALTCEKSDHHEDEEESGSIIACGDKEDDDDKTLAGGCNCDSDSCEGCGCEGGCDCGSASMIVAGDCGCSERNDEDDDQSFQII